MKMDSEQITVKLNALVQKNSDAEKGFEKAAEISKASSLKEWFMAKALERRMFREELKLELHSLGHPCVKTPSLIGDFHRVWMDVKAAFSLDNDEAMLKEAIRGERAALEEYSDVLAATTLGPTTKAIIRAQRSKIENGLVILQAIDNIEFQEES